ncbi:MAG: hypothetical protein ACLFRR_08985 [Spirochaetaceae bacterium]
MESAYALGASRRQVILHVAFPSRLPDMFTGLRVAIGFAYTTLVSAKQYPDIVVRYLETRIRAVELIREDPERAPHAVAEEARRQMDSLLFLDGEEQLSPEHLGTPERPGAPAEVFLADEERTRKDGCNADMLSAVQITEARRLWTSAVRRRAMPKSASHAASKTAVVSLACM